MLESSLLATLAGALVIAMPAASTTVPPAASFFDKSWDQMSKMAKFRVECNVTPGALNVKSGLTADQQKVADLLDAALPRLVQKETDIMAAKEKKFSAVVVKSPSFQPYNAYQTGKLSYDQAKSDTMETPQLSVYFVVGTKGLYYRAAATDPWKFIKSKELATNVLKSVAENNITLGLNKADLGFDFWETDKVAVYKGKMSQELAKSIVGGSVGSAFTDKDIGTDIKIFVDKATKNWLRTESTLTVDHDAASFTLTRSCQLGYGKDAVVTVPSKATPIDVQAGANEFVGLANKVQ